MTVTDEQDFADLEFQSDILYQNKLPFTQVQQSSPERNRIIKHPLMQSIHHRRLAVKDMSNHFAYQYCLVGIMDIYY